MITDSLIIAAGLTVCALVALATIYKLYRALRDD